MCALQIKSSCHNIVKVIFDTVMLFRICSWSHQPSYIIQGILLRGKYPSLIPWQSSKLYTLYTHQYKVFGDLCLVFANFSSFRIHFFFFPPAPAMANNDDLMKDSKPAFAIGTLITTVTPEKKAEEENAVEDESTPATETSEPAPPTPVNKVTTLSDDFLLPSSDWVGVVIAIFKHRHWFGGSTTEKHYDEWACKGIPINWYL